MDAAPLPRLIRPSRVLDLLGVSKPTLHRWRRSGAFPAPVRIGPNCIGWPEDVVRQWIAGRQKVA